MNSIKSFVALGVVFPFLVLSAGADAAILTDGSLVLDVTSDGRFQVVSLNGTNIDTTGFVQQQYINGGNFLSGSAVVVIGSSATYTASVGSFQIVATSTILGPLNGNPGSSVFQQSFTITNTGSPASLNSVSFLDPDVGGTTANNTAYDAVSKSVFATAPAIPGRLLASTADSNDGAFGFHNAFLGTLGLSVFGNLNGAVGPVGVGDIEHAVGLNFGNLGAGQSTTLDFRYLFATNLSAPPANFGFGTQAIPEPATVTMFGFGILGLAFAKVGRRKRMKSRF